jgi:transaldolase
MKNPRSLALHDVGQRLWLDNITRQLLPSGTLASYIRELSVTGPFRNQLGIAIATLTYKAYRELLLSDRWRRLEAAGAGRQRLLWASTGTKDPAAPDTLYVEGLAAEATIDTIPEKTLLAFADHRKVTAPLLAETSYAEDIIAKLRHEGLDDNAL